MMCHDDTSLGGHSSGVLRQIFLWDIVSNVGGSINLYEENTNNQFSLYNNCIYLLVKKNKIIKNNIIQCTALDKLKINKQVRKMQRLYIKKIKF